MNPKDDLEVDAQIQNEQKKEDKNYESKKGFVYHHRQNNMLSFLGDLKTLRTERDPFKAAYDNAMKEFNELNCLLLEARDKNKSEIEASEDNLRVLAKDEYRETGSKKLPGGMGIRIMKRLIYDKDEALDWAKLHNLAIALDKKKFETMVKVSSKGDGLDFVKISNEIIATIPTEIKLGEQ